MAVNAEAAKERMEAGMAEHPFVVFSMEARNAEMRAEGFVFQGCGVPEREGMEGPSAKEVAEAKVVAAAWFASKFGHGVEGPHFVSCGHSVSQSQLKREGF